MTIHIEVLSEVQRAIMPVLGPFAASKGFCLGGGTAVALYFGHRRSDDFDWFVSGELGEPLILAEQARQSGLDFEGVQVAPGTLHAAVSGVQVSFFSYPYPQIAPQTLWKEFSGLPLRLALLKSRNIRTSEWQAHLRRRKPHESQYSST